MATLEEAAAAPQGLKTPKVVARKTLTGILYVLSTGCPWEDGPPEYGSPPICWRRLITWEEDGT